MTVSQPIVFLAPDARLGTTAGYGGFTGLWGSDGTKATETLVLQGSQFVYNTIDGSAALPGKLLFTAGGALFVTDPITGLPSELDVPSLPAVETLSFMTSIGDVVLFNAADANTTHDLWRTDGTAAGTSVIPIAASASGLNPTNIDAFNGGALFVGTGTDNPNDLFFTDGTAAGTRELAALPEGYNGIEFDAIGTFDGRVVFVGPGDAGSSALWSTDGTAAGTVRITGIPNASGPSSTTMNGKIFYTNGDELYATDGTAAGSTLVSDLISSSLVTSYPSSESSSAYELMTIGNELLFGVAKSGPDYPYVEEANLWVSDGTAAGTHKLDISGFGSDTVGVDPSDIVMFSDNALFSGIDGGGSSNSQGPNNRGLWITDGTAAGTQEIAAGLNPSNITVLGNGEAYFSGVNGLYETDGTTAGTHLVQAPDAPAGGITEFDPVQVASVPSPLGFSGTSDQYEIAPSQKGNLQVQDLVSNRDGSLTEANARILTFTDETGVFDPTGNAESIARIYLAAYDRTPDIDGLLSYTAEADAGTVSLAQIAAAAPTSAEFLAMYGSLSDTAFVTQLYENADGRAPDPGGLAAYTEALADGVTRGTVLLDIAEGAEAQLHSQDIAGDADNATIYRLYEVVDGRAPDPAGQIAYSSDLLYGQTVRQIAGAMLAGQEYVNKYGTPDNTSFVTDLYHNLLGRDPDTSGLDSYVSDLAAGESRASVVASFIAGDEGRLVTSPATHDGWVSLPH